MKKKLLLIAPVFFDYYKEIIKESEQMGYDVDFICDSPSNSNIVKALGRINKRFISVYTKKYFKKTVIPAINNISYDYVLLVAGMTFAFTPQMVETIRGLNPDAKFVMYQWDSEKNLPFSTSIHKCFDSIYSFDLNDCSRDDKYKFLPLFYTRQYEEVGKNKKENFKYDCSYVGTAHPRKYKEINEISKSLKGLMDKQLIYHYMPSRLKYLYHKVLSPEYKKATLKDFKLEKVPAKEMMSIFKESKCILDAPQAGQTGLTIRTIECLGARRKLITTNTDIKRYDFYNEANILVFDGNIDKESRFFKCEYEELSEHVYLKYSLREWIKYMLN